VGPVSQIGAVVCRVVRLRGDAFSKATPSSLSLLVVAETRPPEPKRQTVANATVSGRGRDTGGCRKFC